MIVDAIAIQCIEMLSQILIYFTTTCGKWLEVTARQEKKVFLLQLQLKKQGYS